MEKERFKVVEDEDGIVIYDESDDYVPGEWELVDDDPDEINLDYLLRASKQQEEAEAKERRKQRWIAVAIIGAIVAYIAGVCYINFKGVL